MNILQVIADKKFAHWVGMGWRWLVFVKNEDQGGWGRFWIQSEIWNPT